jgi:hypothetical protein
MMPRPSTTCRVGPLSPRSSVGMSFPRPAQPTPRAVVVGVLDAGLLLAVLAFTAPVAAPAQAAPISAHAMVHTCCTPKAMKERIFGEAQAMGADFIRVDVELSAIFEGPGGVERDSPDWTRLDQVLAMAREHRLRVLGVLLGPPAYISTCPERWPDAGRCAAADADEFGRMAGEIAAHARDTIQHWEIVNEPDGDWAFEGTPEQYAAMLSAAHDGIKARVPDAQVVFGGVMRPHELGWLERVFATPGADAIHKFDIANVHLRGPVAAVVRRYHEFRAWLGARGFAGPLWVTEHGYPADPAYQVDPAFTGGNAAQAGYLTQSLVGLGEAGAEQVFVTLRDNLDGEYASEGLVHIDPGAEAAALRRESFAAVQRLTTSWDQLMAWRAEQRENERLAQLYQAIAYLEAGEARIARAKFQSARVLVHAAQDAVADASRSARVKRRLLRRLARVRALVAGRRTVLFWHTAYARWQGERAAERRLAAEALKKQIAGG